MAREHFRPAVLNASADHLIVFSPDHPLILNGPDAIITSPGRIVAAFSPRASEGQQPATLLARLALSRFAYPKHTRCILIGEKDIDFQPELARNFHEVLHWSESRRLSSFLNDPNANPHQIQTVPMKLRQDHMAKYFAAETISNQFSRKTDALNQPDTEVIDSEMFGLNLQPMMIESWVSNKRKSRSHTVFWDQQSESVVADLRRSPSIRTLERVIEHTVRIRYRMDRGIVYDSMVSVPMFIQDSSRLRPGWDQQKVARAAAFAGCALVSSQSPASLTEEASLFRQYQQLRMQSPLPTWDFEEHDAEGEE